MDENVSEICRQFQSLCIHTNCFSDSMFVGLFAYLYHDFMDFLVFELDRVSQSFECVGEFGIQYLVK